MAPKAKTKKATKTTTAKTKKKTSSKATKLKKNDFEKYKQELLKYRDELKESVKTHAASLPDTGMIGASGDSSDHASADFSAEMFGMLLEKQAGTLEEVERALQKIETGEYGICEDCGKPISAKRLKALPWAKFCIECQDKIDRIEQLKRIRRQFDEVTG